MNVQIKAKLLLSLPLLLGAAGSMAASIFTPDSQPTGWVPQPSLSSNDIKSGSENFYLMDYSKDFWSGDVLAYKINANAVVQSVGPWDSNNPTATSAGSILDSQIASATHGSRFIVTRNAAGVNVPFRWGSLTGPATTTGSQQNSISSNATLGGQIVDFVRGDRSNEVSSTSTGGIFRARDSVLGDILHSNLQYWNHNSTTRRLYVGANDGMLHVFNADTGHEVFAYVPSMLIPKLKDLTANPYVHTHFVDGPIGISNIDFGGTLKTYLVGGLGAGGKGLYALDITDPSATGEDVAATKIAWEITPTQTGYANLGYVYGVPRISRLNDGTPVAIVGNGYVNGGNGHAVLYIINITDGALIKAIDTGSGTTTSPNGLSTPTLLDTTGDNKVDYVYAGDIDGNLWKFDLTGADPSLYSVVDKNTGVSGAQPLFTTSPAQAITTAPALYPHPNGGQMVAFATGRILTSGDLSDASVHYVYGIWDGAPAANAQLLTQTLTAGTYTSGNITAQIRTITANNPDWTAGSANHYGWKVALPAGERVVGELPFYANGRFYFRSTNPNTLAQAPNNGKNWLNEFVFLSGGSPSAPIFDINKDNAYNELDLDTNCTPTSTIFCVPVSKYFGGGVFSQPVYVEGLNFATTLFAFHPDLPATSSGGTGGSVVAPPDPGVSGGHFDFDIYYWGTSTPTTVITPTSSSETKSYCAKTSDVSQEFNMVSPNFCSTGKGFSSGYGFMTNYTTSPSTKLCGGSKRSQTVTCNTYTTTTMSRLGQYSYKKHVHEYDDIYDVTGVNMLNASEPLFNLTPNVKELNDNKALGFKVLVMNQYLNPAAKIRIGGPTFESVKTFKGLASQTDPAILLGPTTTGGLPTYSRNTIGTFAYNLPLDAFKSRDWWGDGGAVRAGLIPIDWQCATKLNTDGSMYTTGTTGVQGPNGERFNGALTFQIIRADTPASALELNHSATNKKGDGTAGTPTTLSDSERVKYGWRVKQSLFSTYVIAEYTTYWHHPTNICYGKTGWVADAAEDLVSDATPKTPATGADDPKDGLFTGGTGGVISTVTTVNANTTTTVITYVGNLQYTRTDVVNGDGTTTVTQVFTDGSTTVTTVGAGTGTGGGTGVSSGSGVVDSAGTGGNGETNRELLSNDRAGRLSWRELFQ
jgi:Tfp pilus tip-associated adhesin PilY1